jgi:hypothetical protein
MQNVTSERCCRACWVVGRLQQLGPVQEACSKVLAGAVSKKNCAWPSEGAGQAAAAAVARVQVLCDCRSLWWPMPSCLNHR